MTQTDSSSLWIARLSLSHLWLLRECHRMVRYLGMREWIAVIVGAGTVSCMAMIVVPFIGSRQIADVLISGGLGFLLGGSLLAYLCQVFGKPWTIEYRYAVKWRQVQKLKAAYQELGEDRQRVETQRGVLEHR